MCSESEQGLLPQLFSRLTDTDHCSSQQLIAVQGLHEGPLLLMCGNAGKISPHHEKCCP